MRLKQKVAVSPPSTTTKKFDALRQFQGYERWKAWDESKFGLYALEDGIYFQEELKRCGFIPSSGLQVLEVGFGAGKFAAWATKQGLEYRGLETIETLVSQGKQQGYRVSSSSEDLSAFVLPESLDLVVAFDGSALISRIHHQECYNRPCFSLVG